MDLASIRPVLSGAAGGAIATLLVSYWSRRLPTSYGSKPRAILLHQHRAAVWAANTLFLTGVCIGVALYPIGGFADTDVRPMLWGFGLASVLPLLSIYLVSAFSRRNIKEAFVAFSWGQGSPIWATYGVLGAGVVAFAFAVASLRT